MELGLLEVEFRRLTGRSGPGAGRPSKLYRRAARTIAVSLPERRFDLAGHLLARAIERSADGTPIGAALRDVARTEGDAYGARLRTAESAPDGDAPGTPRQELDRVRHALSGQGYEPRPVQDELVLANCPFHDLARAHTDLVCPMNQAYISGVADGLDCRHVEAVLDPDTSRCCVVVRADAAASSPVR